MDSERYYTEFALAYVRGKLPALASRSAEEALAAGAEAGLRLHRFKRTSGLDRVRRVLGVLKGFAPARLLDVGSGRGVFLWPLLDELPEVEVTAVDVLPHRVADLDAVRRGGISRLAAHEMSVTALAFPDRAFDAVTVLEVLEHLEDPAAAAREALRVAQSAVVATVPSKEDDNPEHIHLFDRRTLEALFREAGAARVTIEYVLNHIVVVAVP